MKKLIAFMLAVAALSGCTSKTDLGPCVGIGEKQNPALEYKISAWNLVVGLIFIELLAPPVIVAVDEFYCPVAKTTTPTPPEAKK